MWAWAPGSQPAAGCIPTFQRTQRVLPAPRLGPRAPKQETRAFACPAAPCPGLSETRTLCLPSPVAHLTDRLQENLTRKSRESMRSMRRSWPLGAEMSRSLPIALASSGAEEGHDEGPLRRRSCDRSRSSGRARLECQSTSYHVSFLCIRR